MSETKEPGAPENGGVLAEVVKHAQVGRCVNGVTHDVNNCLGAIMAYAELVGMDSDLSPDSKRMIAEIAQAVRRSTALLGTLTSIARKERPNATLVDMPKLVERVLAVGNYEMKVAQIELETAVEENMASIIVDEPKIVRSLIALVMNAVDTMDLQDSRRVTVAVGSSGDAVEVAVGSSADPLPESEREGLFEPVEGLPRGARFRLGLCEAREAARFHRGALTYDPSRGFVMRLPRANGLTV